MKLTAIILNIVALTVAGFWLYKTGFDYEPLVTLLGLAGTLIGILADGQTKKATVQTPAIVKPRPSLRPVYWLLLALLIALIALRFQCNSTTGIKGNNNNNNTIQIK